MLPSPVILPHLKFSPSSPLPSQFFPAFQGTAQDPSASQSHSDWLATQKMGWKARVMSQATVRSLKVASWECSGHGEAGRAGRGGSSHYAVTCVLSDLLFSSSSYGQLAPGMAGAPADEASWSPDPEGIRWPSAPTAHTTWEELWQRS